MTRIATRQLRALRKKVFSALSFPEQFIVVLRRVIASYSETWVLYLMQMFEKIGKPIDKAEALKIKNYMFNKVKSFFPNPADANDAMEDVIEFLIRNNWFEKLDEDKTVTDITKLLVNKTVQELSVLKKKKWIRDKGQEYYGPAGTDVIDTLEERLQGSPESTMRLFEQEMNDLEWQIIFKDFVKFLEDDSKTQRSKFPLADMFRKYYLEQYSLTELAEEVGEQLGSPVEPASIKFQLVGLSKDFIRFLSGYQKVKVVKEIVENLVM